MRLPVVFLFGMLGMMGAFMASGMLWPFAASVLAFMVTLVLTQVDMIKMFQKRAWPALLNPRKEKKPLGTGSGIAVRRGHFGALLEAEPITPDRLMTMLKPLMSLGPIRRMERYLVKRVRTAIFESGRANDSMKVARHGMMHAIISAPPSVAVAAALAVTLHPGFLGLCAVPVAVMFSGLVQLKNAKSQRRSAIGHELPVFIACASIMEKVGVSFYEFITRITKSKTTLFPVLRQDALIFRRNVDYMAMSHTTALRKVAETHPSESFKEIVANYAAAYTTSGTNTASTMAAATESAFRAMQNSVKSYTSEANGIAQLVLMIMAVMPILALATTFVATGRDAISMTIMVMLLLPIIIVALLMSADGKQPRTHNAVPLYRPPIVLAAVAVPATLAAGIPLWGVLGAAVAVWGGANALMARRAFSDTSKMDGALPAFAQYVTDSRMEGMEIRDAVRTRSKNNDRKDALSPVLRDMSRQMMFGKSLAAAAESARTTSWLSRILFFVLSQVQESGGGDTHSLQAFANFVKEYVESRREMVASLRGSIIMGYAIPLLMVVMLLVTSEMTGSVAGELEGLEAMQINFPTMEQAEEIREQSNFLIVECSILIGFLVSKITYFTTKHSAHVCALAVLGTASCVVMPFIEEVTGTFL